MPDDIAIIDFSNAKQRQIFLGWTKTLEGLHRVNIKKVRANRSTNANAYYWGIVLPHIVAGLQEAWGETLDVEEAHEWLKGRFNAKVIVDRASGEVKGRRPCSTATLDTKEFGMFLEKVIQFAAEHLNVEVPVPT